ncbi:hypothetical protein SAMN05216376_10650 [Mameliella alba]|uniref:hypothetical protein n=1 Tax=Mameliella alba TaxID=561184 RepID=UPI00088777EE|nr:hypothetical protein [Mameliella alba]PTR39853.1 hypothetical protein LX94_02228 [Mameliella alba]GGF61003.1 hypothetical protein GCM10011319_22620 [Mameliella alba]SDD10481.1 hypothetical protein SAMN05216376_10650 [Mameliella alba]
MSRFVVQDPLPTSPDTPVALLVDGDNISAAHAAQLIQIASRKGRVTVARVYATTMKLALSSRIGTFVLAKRPHLFQLDPKGPEEMVRFLPEGFDSPS